MALERVARGSAGRRAAFGAVHRLATALLPALAGAGAGAAQEPADEAFGRVRVEAGALHGIGGELLGAWGPARGAFVQLAFPWAGGELGGRLERVRHPGLETAPGDLDELRPLVVWTRALPLAGPIVLRLGGELGIDYFELPRDDNPLETEAVAGLSAELGWRVADAWGASAGVRRRWTFTDPRLRRDAVTLSLDRSFDLPRRTRRAFGGELATAASLPSGVEGLSPARLRTARWSSVLADVPGWEAVSIDGVSVRVAPAGAPSTLSSRVAVRLDGWEMPLDLLGVTTLDRLPLEPWAVESVRVRPGVEAGLPGVDAVLELSSRSLPRGVGGRIRALGANATGDGGPRALLKEGPNVESLEWGFGAELGWAAEDVALRAEGSQRRRWVSELPVYRRNFEAVDTELRWPWIDVRRGRVALEADVGPLRHQASLAGSRMDDFVLLPGLVREVPAQADLTAAWLHGHGEVADGWTLGYGLGRTANALRTTPNRLERSLAWRETTSAAGLSARTGRGGIALRLERRRARGLESLTDSLDGRGSVHAHLRLPLGPTGRGPALELAGSALRTDGRWGGGASAALVRGTARSSSGLRAAGERAPAAERRGFWLPEARGAGVLARWYGAAEADAPPALRRWTAEAWHRHGPVDAWVEARVRVDGGSGWWVPRSEAVTSDGVPSLSGPPVLAEGSGRLGALVLRYGWRRGPLEAGGSHTVRAALDGNAALEEAHASLPRHRSVHHVRLSPLPDLALWARLEARSATRHEAFRAAGPGFPASLSGGAFVDLGAEKALLGGRAAAEIVVRDVLDRELVAHPLAGTPGLTLEILGRLRLGAQPSPDETPAPPSPRSSASRRR